MKTQLLCTFTSKPRLNDTLDIIITCNDVLYEKVYVFQNENDLGQLICTYNTNTIMKKVSLIPYHFTEKNKVIHSTQSTH
jgi:hypothetical protein